MLRDRFIPAIGLLLACVTLAAGSGRASSPRLVRIPLEGAGARERLAQSGLAPVRILDGWALAWGEPEEIRRARAAGFDASSLGPRRSDRAYAVVQLDGRGVSRPEPAIESFGRVLWRDPRTAIIEYRPEEGPNLCAFFEILPILDRPVRFMPPRAAQLARAPTEPDPLIASFVEQVDSESLEVILRHLQGYATRASNTLTGFKAGGDLHDRLGSYASIEVSDYSYNDRMAPDVLAVQRGRVAPEEVYVIGAHYDSTSRTGRAPGADDNASGTAAVLEAARILSCCEFEATIVYIAFSGEELGLFGSDAWATHARGMGVDIRGVINLDMIGWLAPGDTPDLDLISNDESAAFKDFLTEVVKVYLPDHPLIDSYFHGGNSDQQSFWDQGFAAVTFHEDTDQPNPYWHTSEDIVGVSVNDLGFMRRNVQAAVATLATLARPSRVRIAHTPLTDPSVGAEGYRILAKIESNAPLWVDSLGVNYRVDGGAFRWLVMRAAGEAGLYEATIPRQAPGSRVEYAIHARDIEGRPGDDPAGAPMRLHSFVVGLIAAFADDFEEDRGWTVGSPSDSAATGVWVRAVPIGTVAQPSEDVTPGSGRVCFVTGNGEPGGESGAADVDGGRTTLTSPRIDLFGLERVSVEYHRWFVDSTTNDDTLRVLLSGDDGVTWRCLEAVRSSEAAWKDVRFDSLEQRFSLSDRTRLRFVAEDVGAPSLVEAAIDGVRIQGVSARIRPSPSARSSIVQVSPNPFRSSAVIVYDLLADTPATLNIYDVQGRRVARLAVELPRRGRHEVGWDGTDLRGNRVASGVYFIRLETDEPRTSSVRILKLR